MPQMTAHKALAAFFTSLLAIVAMFGVSTDWATPSLIESVAAIAGAVLSGVVTYMVPNRPRV